MNYYNEHDPNAAQWLRNLIAAGLIPAGDVDERSIEDVRAEDVVGYRQCHFFAGIGGWPLALAIAGWPADLEIWTGSCPCPPFSSAGKKKHCPECQGKDVVPHPLRTGIFVCCDCEHEWFADGRHLWPEMLRLVKERRPPVVFGEQVAGADGVVWLSGVRATLEGIGYAVGGGDIPAAGVGAPHIRQRLYWVADAHIPELQRVAPTGQQPLDEQDGGVGGGMEHAPSNGRHERRAEPVGRSVAGGCGVDGLGNADDSGSQGRGVYSERAHELSPWSSSLVIYCRDGKYRRISLESCVFPLAPRIPRKLGPGFAGLDGVGIRAARANRVGRLKGYGNAIVPQVAAEFIRAYMDTKH